MKLKKIRTICNLNNKWVIIKNDLEYYNSIETLEIILIVKNMIMRKKFTDLKIIKSNPNILNKLPLNRYYENNIKVLIIQNKIETLTKEKFKYSKNLEYISIPLSVKK